MDLFGFMTGKEKRAMLYSSWLRYVQTVQSLVLGEPLAKIENRLWGLGFGLGTAPLTLLAIHCSNKGPLSCTLDGEVSFGKGHGPFGLYKARMKQHPGKRYPYNLFKLYEIGIGFRASLWLSDLQEGCNYRV